MAKVEGFKNKLTKAQEDLFKALESEKEKKHNLFIKITTELTKQNKANVKSLNSLNKQYLELCKKNNLSLEEYIAKINELNNELQLLVEKYSEYPNEETELVVFTEQAENKIKALTNKFKRETQDINIKIDRIEKELKELLETRKDTYESEVTDFRANLLELDKRKRFEITKIQGNTIKEYDELQLQLLKENNRVKIKEITKEIKRIRLNGLLEEKECMYRHLAEQEKAELEYLKLHYDYKTENISLEREYNFRIIDTKFDRSMIEYNYKKNVDSTNNTSTHLFDETIKKIKLQRSNEFEEQYKLINQDTIAQYEFEKVRTETEVDNIKNIYGEIQKFDNLQTTKFIELNDKGLAILEKEVGLYHKNIVLTINHYVQNITQLYSAYFSDLMKKEREFVNELLINAIKGAFLQGNDYNNFITKVEEVFKAFSEKEEETIKAFNDFLTVAVNNLIIQVESFINGIKQLNNTISTLSGKFHEDINAILEEAKLSGIGYIENIKVEANNQIQTKITANEELYNSRCLEIKQDRENTEAEYNQREQAIKDLQDIQEEQYRVDYQEFVKVREEAKVALEETYVKLANEYLAEYQEKIANLKAKFVTFREDVEKEYKIKIGLL